MRPRPAILIEGRRFAMKTIICRAAPLAVAIAALGLGPGCGGDVKVIDAPPPKALPDQPTEAQLKKGAPSVKSRSQGNPDDYTR